MTRMSKLVQNNAKTRTGGNSDHSHGSGIQASCNVPSNLGEMAPTPLELANNVGEPNYWPILVAKLMKRIS